MKALPYIKDLFKAVSGLSIAIEGRFYLCPRNGQEINWDEMGKLLQDLVRPDRTQKKYPIHLMMPPVITGDYTDKDPWAQFRSTHFFLNTTFYTGTSQTMNPNPATRTSTHTVDDNWHDMMRCAVDFTRALNRVQRVKSLVNESFRLDQQRERVIIPVTEVGADRLSGVRLELFGSVYIGCEMEDYDTEDLDAIVIPAADSHGQHQL